MKQHDNFSAIRMTVLLVTGFALVFMIVVLITGNNKREPLRPAVMEHTGK